LYFNLVWHLIIIVNSPSLTHVFFILHIKGYDIISSGGVKAKASAPLIEEADELLLCY
jgi:hypothetical protein